MYNDDYNSGILSQNLILDGVDPIESIEDLLRKCGFFDAIAPQDTDDDATAN